MTPWEQWTFELGAVFGAFYSVREYRRLRYFHLFLETKKTNREYLVLSRVPSSEIGDRELIEHGFRKRAWLAFPLAPTAFLAWRWVANKSKRPYT